MREYYRKKDNVTIEKYFEKLSEYKRIYIETLNENRELKSMNKAFEDTKSTEFLEIAIQLDAITKARNKLIDTNNALLKEKKVLAKELDELKHKLTIKHIDDATREKLIQSQEDIEYLQKELHKLKLINKELLSKPDATHQEIVNS